MYQKIRAKRSVPESYEEKLVVGLLPPHLHGLRQATLYDILLTSCYTVFPWNCRPKALCLEMLRCLSAIHTRLP